MHHLPCVGNLCEILLQENKAKPTPGGILYNVSKNLEAPLSRILHPIRVVILFSGNGSNMQNLIEKLHQKTFFLQNKQVRLEILAGICNQKDAYGIKRLEAMGIPCTLLLHQDFASRQDFDDALMSHLEHLGVDLVLLAGFMRILTPKFCQSFRILNLHPSLLPKFKGAHGMRQSFESEERVAGVSVHWVNEELDGGEIVLQKSLVKIPGERFEDFEERIHALEYEAYPEAVLLALHAII
ncbi:phosphoribosylglycinamide formyltransferase [Helicobacter mustelae]|uniref:Phosphoribosylglycinamide formyltransferase n=1 Tax=Helicobacter mustelae (strain ATCC 43772 / CCUG 25715 / CIP 103759 / LMG 18044 / NCTC 12198 / R85-136P) TaxID=679897 RepID=D3UHQ7_HELM1|nr:phosphoribosylglycinamide formyltransferase [Helicobacter mustelae]CBG40029.1 phosphoribosylglycinamide formyltransferase [Helicobacter mustelae 12198]